MWLRVCHQIVTHLLLRNESSGTRQGLTKISLTLGKQGLVEFQGLSQSLLNPAQTKPGNTKLEIYL
jgi:hypothetical protein